MAESVSAREGDGCIGSYFRNTNIKTAIQHILGKLGYQLVSERRARVEAPWSRDDLSLYYELYPKESVDKRRFFNIGAGGWSHRAWTNIDKASMWYANQQDEDYVEVELLALTRLPIDDSVAEAAYCSHVIEHVHDEADANLFSEICRVLKKGGVFRVTCPDAELACQAYINNDRHFFSWIDNYSRPDEMKRIGITIPMREATTAQIFLYLIASSVSELHANTEHRISDDELRRVFDELPLEEALAYCSSKCQVEIQRKSPGNHMNSFTKKKLVRMLRDAGFSDVQVSAYGQSRCPVMRNVLYFDYRRPNMSMYVDAVK